MSFLENLQPEQRERFDALGTDVVLDDGAWLLRRGDVGGDLYLVVRGALEALEGGGGGSHILLVLEPGDVLGDVSFLDDAPRPADVRARGATVVRRWRRDDVLTATWREPTLAARLYEAMARNLAQRVRQLADSAVSRVEPRSRGLDVDGDPAAHADALLEDAKACLERADGALRARPVDPASREVLRLGLDGLEAGLGVLFANPPDTATCARLSRHVRRELRPWLGRSRLADLCLHDTGRATVTADVIDHVLADVARGEGWLGTHVDRWLLDRASLAARRAADGVILDTLRALPPAGRRRVLFLDALAATRLDRLAGLLGPDGGTLVLVDPSADALAEASDRLASSGRPVRTEIVREGVVQLALGRVGVPVPPSDVALVYDLLSYLPDRIAISVMRWAASELTPSGTLLAVNLEPADDDALLAQVLHWPAIRRTHARFERVVRGAGLVVERVLARVGPATVVQLCRAA